MEKRDREEREASSGSKQVTTMVTGGRLCWGSQGSGVQSALQSCLGSQGAGLFIYHLLLLIGLELALYVLNTEPWPILLVA